MDLDRSANEGPGSRRSGYSDRRGIGLNAFADGPSGGCWFWPGRHRPGTVAAIGSDVCLAERNSQQARAQEHDARRCQGKKSVGDYVVVAHETPTTQMLVGIY